MDMTGIKVMVLKKLVGAVLYIINLLYFAWADQRVQPFYNYHIV